MTWQHGSADGQPGSPSSGADAYPSRSVLIAGGIGAFTPRKLPSRTPDFWYGKGLHDRILDPKVFIFFWQNCACCWWRRGVRRSTGREPAGIARFRPHDHRRDGFRAHARPCGRVHELCAAGKMELRTFWELKAIHGGDAIEAVTIFNNTNEEEGAGRPSTA